LDKHRRRKRYPMMACLLAQYGENSAIPLSPAVDAVFTIANG
jgi:hypothetical protein